LGYICLDIIVDPVRNPFAPGAGSQPPELADGTILEREYKGETHVVRRIDGRYEYKQQRCNSLTEIAWRITGTQ